LIIQATAETVFYGLETHIGEIDSRELGIFRIDLRFSRSNLKFDTSRGFIVKSTAQLYEAIQKILKFCVSGFHVISPLKPLIPSVCQ